MTNYETLVEFLNAEVENAEKYIKDSANDLLTKPLRPYFALQDSGLFFAAAKAHVYKGALGDVTLIKLRQERPSDDEKLPTALLAVVQSRLVELANVNQSTCGATNLMRQQELKVLADFVQILRYRYRAGV